MCRWVHVCVCVCVCVSHYSATFNEEVRKLMSLSLKQPVRLAADAVAAVPKDLRQEVLRLKVRDGADTHTHTHTHTPLPVPKRDTLLRCTCACLLNPAVCRDVCISAHV